MFGIVLALVVVLAGVSAADDQPVAKTVQGAKAGSAPFVHVVVFQLKKDAPSGSVDQVIKDCHDMLGKIKSVRTVKAGKPAEQAPGDIATKDYDVALLVLVDDAAGLKAYLEDPLHLKFVEKYGKLFEMEKLRIFDFVDQKK
jgi:hypothetical protein